MGPIFLVHLWTFLVKIAYGLTFFLFLDRKRTKLSPKLISLRIFGNFFYEQVLCLMCILVQTSVFGSSDKFFSKLFCFWILCKPTSDSGIWFWLDKFKLKEGPENWSSGAFETDDFGWNLSKNAIFG